MATWPRRVSGTCLWKEGAEVALPQLSPVFPGNWGISDRGIYFIDFAGVPPGEPVPLKFCDFVGRKVSMASSLGKVKFINHARFSVTRDGRGIVWEQLDRAESNLMLVDNFH